MVKRVDKPWGYEEIWSATSKYAGKLLHIYRTHKLSLQYHEVKEETIYVLKGRLEIIFGESKDFLFSKTLQQGEAFHIHPNLIHRFSAPYDDVILIEVSTPELNDVVRLDDIYNRD